MNPMYFCGLIPLLALVFIAAEEQRLKRFSRRAALKRKIGGTRMTELIKDYLGKDCIVYTMNSQVSGRLVSCEGGWVSVDGGKQTELVNLDYVTRIRDYPLGRDGRRKAVVVD